MIIKADPGEARRVIFVIWLISFLSASPWALFTKVLFIVRDALISKKRENLGIFPKGEGGHSILIPAQLRRQKSNQTFLVKSGQNFQMGWRVGVVRGSPSDNFSNFFNPYKPHEEAFLDDEGS